MISELSAKYQVGATHTADITDGKVTNRPSVDCLGNDMFGGLWLGLRLVLV